MVVGISILIFMTLRTRRSLAVAHIGLLAAVFVVGVLPQLLPGHRAKVEALRGFMETAMKDLDHRGQAWGTASPIEILNDAQTQAEDDLVYRFEEHLQNVTMLEAPEIDATEGVLFDIPRDGEFVAVGPVPVESEIAQGKQVFADYPGGMLCENGDTARDRLGRRRRVPDHNDGVRRRPLPGILGKGREHRAPDH